MNKTEERKKHRREYYLANKERKLLTNKIWKIKNRDKVLQMRKSWRDRNKLKVLAHNLKNRAVQVGKLKPLPCTICGEEKSYGHHEDYNKPLEVVWLCHRCHTNVHCEVSRGN